MDEIHNLQAKLIIMYAILHWSLKTNAVMEISSLVSIFSMNRHKNRQVRFNHVYLSAYTFKIHILDYHEFHIALLLKFVSTFQFWLKLDNK